MIETPSFTVKYEITSELGDIEGNRYINNITGIVHLVDDYGNPIEEAGKLKLSILLLGSAMNDEYSPYDIFDTRRELFEIGEEIYDFDSGYFVEEIIDHYAHDFAGNDILVIERMEILPKFRNLNLGKKIIKDIYVRFSGGVAIFVLKAFPLQHEASKVGSSKEEKEWDHKMCIDALEQDLEKSEYKLYAYYKSLGFENVMGNEIFLLNPALINEEIKNIELL
jgi:hypothetical protein